MTNQNQIEESPIYYKSLAGEIIEIRTHHCHLQTNNINAMKYIGSTAKIKLGNYKIETYSNQNSTTPRRECEAKALYIKYIDHYRPLNLKYQKKAKYQINIQYHSYIEKCFHKQYAVATLIL